MPKLKLVAGPDPAHPRLRPLGTHGQALWTRVLADSRLMMRGPGNVGARMRLSGHGGMCARPSPADGPVIRPKGGAIREHPSLRAGVQPTATFVVRTLGKPRAWR